MLRKDKSIGAKVEVREVTVEINPKVKWRKIKKVPGIIVENKGYEQYYHTCSGAYTYKTKHVIKNDTYPTYAIKLNEGITDVEGNNIIVVREFDLKFLDRIEVKKKPITEKQYLRAKKIVEEYESLILH